MNTAYSSYPGRFLMDEPIPGPITDPPWLISPHAWHDPPKDTGQPQNKISSSQFQKYF